MDAKQTKKEISVLLVVALVAMLLTGCSDYSTVTLNADGSGSYSEEVTVSKKLWDMCEGEMGQGASMKESLNAVYPNAVITEQDVKIDGVASKRIQMSMDFKNKEEFSQMMSVMNMYSVKLNKSYFSRGTIYTPVEEESGQGSSSGPSQDDLETLIGENADILHALSDEMKDMDVKMTATFPYAVKKTNGKVLADGKTVVWDAKELEKEPRIYALFREQTSKARPAFHGAENGKSYNTGVTLRISSENLLKKVSIDGKSAVSDYLFLSAEGAHSVTATDLNGNKSKIKFYIDMTKPKVAGVADSKTYKKARVIRFSDKGSGIKKAALNGKTIRTGKRVSKKGSYTLIVSDKAGNVKTVKFKIA